MNILTGVVFVLFVFSYLFADVCESRAAQQFLMASTAIGFMFGVLLAGHWIAVLLGNL